MKHFWHLLFFPVMAFGQIGYFPPTTGNAWDTIAPTQLNFCEPRLDSLKTFLESKGTKAFLLAKDGKLVIEWYLNNHQPSAQWYWASAGKTLTAAMVGMAQQDQYLNITDPVSTYLGLGWTSLPAPKEALITIENLLTMTSGLEFNVPDLNCNTPACLLYRTDAGNQWYYHNGAYLLLKDVVEAASGKNFNVYLNQVFGFAGINPVFLTTPVSPHVAFSPARVMLRFGLLAQNNGIWDTTPVFTDSTYFSDWMQPSQTINPAYGYLWWLNGSATHRLPGFNFSFPGPMVPNAPADARIAAGLNEQRLYVVPSKGWTVVRMGDPTGAPSAAISSFDDQLWAHLNWLDCNQIATEDLVNHHTKMRLYPNPAQTVLHVMDIPSVPANFAIKTIGGSVLQTGTLAETIVLNGLAAGMYFLEVQTATGQFWVEKFVVRD